MKYGIDDGQQEYICKACGRKFTNRDNPYGKRSTVEDIGTSISSYYDGLSFSDIARHLTESGNPVNESTVYRWIVSYTEKANKITRAYKPTVCDIWVVDETVVKVDGRNVWYWDVLCENTRFLIASHLSKTRTMQDVITVMRRALDRTQVIPRFIVSDCLGVYPDGIDQVFGAEAKHIQSRGFTDQVNNNIIERFHGTIKERYKVMRGFKTPATALLILDGFGTHYNFFRPHMSLDRRTPAEVAKIKALFKTWTDFVRQDK